MLLLFAALLLPQALSRDALQGITEAEAFAHVKELADDSYMGREAGTEGADKAAEYIVALLKKWGLKPGASDGAWLQPFAGGMKNVLAVVEGSDPKLKGEFVAVGAHYDHIGMIKRRCADPINNGADDNASGTAAVLEVAQAFASLKDKDRPKRSVLFAWWSGEEKGLLGSRHFVKNPTVKLASVVAYLNLDMVGRGTPATIDIEGTGCSPDLKALFEKVNAAKVFWKIKYDVVEVKPDTDHYPFWEAGVPAVEFFSGYHADYHKPGDEAEKIDKTKLETVGRFVALSAWDLAVAAKRPGFQKK